MNNTNNEVQEIEILKGVAQAWLCHSKRSTNNGYDAYRWNFPAKASRFKLEAANSNNSLITSTNYNKHDVSSRYWDFNQSLLDSYEIVTLSKRLERGLVLEDEIPVRRRRRESNKSLRSLFSRLSSKRFNLVDIIDIPPPPPPPQDI